jgi:alpha-tubulin suppressor-like RCC1 family protein
MGLEVGTYISDLDSSNPSGLDDRKQGDDHVRLIKYILKHTFPGAGGVGYSTAIVATEAELNRLTGVTSNVQTQLNALFSANYAPLASPVFTGNPQAPTPADGDNDTSIATTAFVKNQAYAPLASPVFTGDPRAPTPAINDNDTSIATTAFVTTAAANLKADILATVDSPISFIARGNSNFTVATANGRVFAWGYNVNGTLGDGTVSDNVMTEIQFPSYLSAGGYTITQFEGISDTRYALFSNGELYGWGDNSTGQLGIGSTVDQRQPVLLLSNVALIIPPHRTADYNYDSRAVCIVKKNDNTYWLAGYNVDGILANGVTANQTSWVQLNPPATKTFSKLWLSSGYSYSLFCKTADNLIFAVGNNASGQLGLGNNTNQTSWVQVTYFNAITDVTDIVTNGCIFDGSSFSNLSSTIVLTTSGDIHVVGNNSYGQLGLGNFTSTTSFAKIITGKVAVKVDKAALTSYAMFNDNSFAAWGHNITGQIGNGNTADQNSLYYHATSISNFWLTTPVISRSYYNGVIYRSQANEIWSFGFNSSGYLGLGNNYISLTSSTPAKIMTNMYDIKDIVCSGQYTAAALLVSYNSTNKIMVCGDGANYKLNNAVISDRYTFKSYYVK